MKSARNLYRLSAGLLSALILACLPAGLVHATAPTPIGNCVDLQKIGNDPSYPRGGSYTLSGDIDCTAATHTGGALDNGGQGFAPLTTDVNPFIGTLDGNNHSVIGLKINRPSDDLIGLFAAIDGGTVKNINFVGGAVIGANYVGTVVGQGGDITLTNVTSNVPVTSTSTGTGYAGGLIGSNDTGDSFLTSVYYNGEVTGSEYSTAGLIGDNDGNATIDKSGSSANISCDDTVGSCDYVGGLVGDSDGVLTISKSFATGNINAGNTQSDSVGGLVGWSDEDHITDSFATGNVIGFNNTGGLLGYVNTGTLDKAYSSGSVTGASTNIGGFIGRNGGITVTNSFFDNTTAAIAACGAGSCTGVTGLSSAQMKVKTNFTGAGWDFANTWRQNGSDNAGFPFLQWAGSTTAANPVTGKNADLAVSAGCVVDSMAVKAESSNSTADSGYDFPNGMMDFTLSCGTGATAQVTQYFYGVTQQNYVVRKYNPNTHAYSTVPNATISYATIGGLNTAIVSYPVTDGGALDSDGVVNGTIVDPAGLAVSNAPAAPSTGFGQPVNDNVSAILILGGAFGLAAAFRPRLFAKK